MNRVFTILCILVLLASCSSDEPITVDEQDQITQQLQNIINEKIGTDADKLVGVSVSIRVGSEERWRLTGGLSKLNEPIQSNMLFGVGSITKPVVAATVLKLVDEGVLNLNDRISDWLSLDNPNVDESATIFELLTHSSGFYGYMYTELWDMAENNLNTPIPQSTLVNFIGPPVDVPGNSHNYSNSNYLILGMIVEAAAQSTIGEVMREKFWTPLGLDNIYFGTNEPIVGPIATPWRDTNDDGILEDIADQYGPAYHSIFYCAADVFSTASDLSMWAQHLFNGNALSLQSRQHMMTRYFDIPDPVFVGYGLGVREVIFHGRTTWGHTGGMRGYGAYMFYDPISQVSIAMLNNQSRSEDGPILRYELVNELLDVVFDAL